MKEEIYIGGKKVSLLIEPHATQEPGQDLPSEYFTASYAAVGPAPMPGGIVFLDEDKTPKKFSSPVEALEFANERLLGLI